jgi:hypothetical protein
MSQKTKIQAIKQASKRFLFDEHFYHHSIDQLTTQHQPYIHKPHQTPHPILNQRTPPIPQPLIMTTYAAYTNLSSPTGSIYHRNPSNTTTITSSNTTQHTTKQTPSTPRSRGKREKWYTFLLPIESPSFSPGLIYDPIVSRPVSRRERRGE